MKLFLVFLFFAAGAFAQTTCVNCNGATTAVITPSMGGPVSLNPSSGIIGLTKIAQMYCFGDSFGSGTGVTDYDRSYCGLLQRDVPAPVYNFSVGATVTADYASRALNNFDPNPNLPNVSVISGTENDGGFDTCGGTLGTNCMKHFQLSENALLAWLSIPFSNRMMASKCTNGGNIVANVAGSGWLTTPTYTWMASPGTNIQPFNTTTLTCTVTTTTAVTQIGIEYAVQASSTQPWSVTIDGVSAVDAGSGTTTFSSGPLQAFHGSQTVGVYRQQYTVTPATSHTVIFSYPNAGGTGSPVIWEGIDYIVPNSAANNVVFQYAENAAWGFFANYSSAISGQISALASRGLPVYFVDINGGVTVGGTTYTVNGTTDVSGTATATCTGSTLAPHPNTCGYEHMREALQAEEYVSGFVFSEPNLESNAALADGFEQNGPLVVREPNGGSVITAASSISLTHGSGFFLVSGTTPISLMPALPVCLEQGNACFVTLLFQTAGASVISGGGTFGAFSQSVFIPVANTAVSFVYDNFTTLWHPVNAPATLALPTVTTVASAATIAPASALFQLTGTTSVGTITAPSGMTATVGGCMDFYTPAVISFIAGGNIVTSGQITTVAGQEYRACYLGSGTGWAIK